MIYLQMTSDVCVHFSSKDSPSTGVIPLVVKQVGVIQSTVGSRRSDLGPVLTQIRSKTLGSVVLNFKKYD